MTLATIDSGIYFHYHVRQSNIQLTCCSYRRNCVKSRLRCSLLNCDYTLQVLQQVAANDYKPNGRCLQKLSSAPRALARLQYVCNMLVYEV